MTRGTVVLMDEPERCGAALSTSLDYADRTVVVSEEDLGLSEVAEVVTPGRAGATIDEAFRIAAGRRMPWVSMRRDIAEPSAALGQMLEATGRRASKHVPGFGALLIGSRPRALERILAVVDLRDGQPSGLMALAAVNVALATGAQLEVLVLGAPGETLRSPTRADDILRIRRDRDLYETARQRAAASDHRASWITVEDPSDRVAITLDQVATGGYDLVIEDLGAISLGGRIGRGRRITRALSPGGPGEIAHALLEHTDVATAIVLDGIRLGVVPPAVVKGGAGVLLAVGMVAAAAPTATASAADRARVRDSVSQSVDAYEQALGQAAALESADAVDDATQAAQQTNDAAHAALAGEAQQGQAAPSASGAAESATQAGAAETAAAEDDGGVEQEGSSDAKDSDAKDSKTKDSKTKDSKTKDSKAKDDSVPPSELKPGEVKPDKAPTVDPGSVNVPEDVDSGDVAEAHRAAQEEKADLATAKEEFAEAQTEAESDVAAVHESAAAAQSAADELQAAQDAYEAAYEQAEADIAEATSLGAGLRGSAADEQLASAEQAEQEALADVLLAQEQADAALADYQTAAAAATESYAHLEKSAKSVTKADAAHQEARATATATEDAYEEMLATARVSPVPGYVVTTHHGETGPMWSTGHHTGVDFAAPTGTEVVAAASGTVSEVSSGGAYGNRIVIDHGDGTFTSYNHLSAVDVSVGQEVEAGQHIGAVGSTGNSSGAHLHFEVTQGGDGWSGGDFLDPEAWLAGDG